MFAKIKSQISNSVLTGDLYAEPEVVLDSVVAAEPSGFWSQLNLPDLGFGGFDFNLDLGSAGRWIGIVVGSALLVSFLFALARYFIYRYNRIASWRKRVFLEIRVPRETQEDAQKEIGQTKQEEDIMSVGEQLFIVMNEYARPELLRWLLGSEKFSLEILSIDQKISFYIMCSERVSHVVERQMISMYPKADIKRHRNVEFFKPGTVAHAQDMKLSSSSNMPFRTYKQMESDPLNSVTSALGNLAKDESAAVQVILTPRTNSWQSKPRKQALKIQQGQNPDSVMGGGKLFEGLDFGFVGGLLGGTGRFFFKILQELSTIFTNADVDHSENPMDKPKKNRDIDYSGKTEAIQLTPQQQEMIKRLEEKSSRPGFGATIRIMASAATEARAEQIVETVTPAFQIYDIRPFNGIEKTKSTNLKKAIVNFATRTQDLDEKDILNTEELNSLWHVPNHLVTNPYINWLGAKKPAIPLEIPGPGDGNVLLGKAKSGMQEKDVYMTPEDRFRHVYALGGSGSGKSVFLTNLILQDIKLGNGVCVVDPHGELVDDVLLRMDESRKDDVIVFSPAFIDKPLGLNMLEYDRSKPTQKTNVIDILFSIWDKLYDLKATGGPMFETYMKNSMRLVMSHEPSGSTLLEIPKILVDEDYRTFKLAMCDEQQVVDFWEKEAQKAGGDASLENMVPYITSKLSPFVNNDYIRPMVGQQKSAINFREAMDNKKIILVKLEKGLIGEQAAYLIGMVVVGNLLLAGMGRNDGLKYNLDGTTTEVLSTERVPFFVYIDEMQNFLFDAIPKALEEIRKYKVGFNLAHQFIKQVVDKGDERIKDSIMANCASKFVFRAGAEDADMLVKEFGPTLSTADLQNPEKNSCNVILLANGQKTTPFNLLPPWFGDEVNVDLMKEIVVDTKAKYGKTSEEIEKDIKDRVDKFMF